MKVISKNMFAVQSPAEYKFTPKCIIGLATTCLHCIGVYHMSRGLVLDISNYSNVEQINTCRKLAV